jgi:hypothetical protein
MHTGELMTIQFRFNGPFPQAVLDRLPTAQIVAKDNHGIVFEAEMFGQGIKMWLQSQAEFVEVLRPEKLRREMKMSITNRVRNMTR